MPRCPACGYENPFGALICVQCATSLVKPIIDPDGTALWKPPLTSEPEVSAHRAPVTYTRSLGENTIALYIGTAPEPIRVEVVRQAVLGRTTPTGRLQPRVDLTPYGEPAKTVSRMHGIIRRNESEWEYEDLASRNGTWLNGVQLEPYAPSPLKSGDRLRLGQLGIEIWLP